MAISTRSKNIILKTRMKKYKRNVPIYEKRKRIVKKKIDSAKKVANNANATTNQMANAQSELQKALAGFKQLNKNNNTQYPMNHKYNYNNSNGMSNLAAMYISKRYPLTPRTYAAIQMQKHYRGMRNRAAVKKMQKGIFKMSSHVVPIDPMFGDFRQGTPGFNKKCTAFLKANIKEHRMGCPSGGDGVFKAMVYQKTVSKLFSEYTPVRRLLCVAQLGAGKTFMMLKVLNNYINRPLAKICIFPTKTTVDNFYTELLKFKNKHRTWLEQQLKTTLSEKSNRATMDKCRKLLWSPPMGTIAPLRVYRVTQFGTLMRDTALFGKRAVYKPLWIVDEIHNLVAPSKKILEHGALKSNLAKMRKYLYESPERLAGFTATPIVDKPEQGMELLNIVKGKHNSSEGNEGFIAWYMQRHPKVFARAAERPKVIDVPVKGIPLVEAQQKSQKHADRYLHASFYFNSSAENIKKIVSNPEVFAPKLARIAEDIARHNKKTVVLIEKTQGLKALAAILEKKHQIKTLILEGDVPSENSSGFKKWANTMEEFNSPGNDYGKIYQVAVCDAATYSEGVSFKSVRLIVLAAVAERFGLMQQRLGRALRSCSHSRLPEEERTVDQLMYRIVLPDTYQVEKKTRGRKKANAVPQIEMKKVTIKSPDDLMFQKMSEDAPKVEKAMCQLEKYAVDFEFLGVKSTCT